MREKSGATGQRRERRPTAEQYDVNTFVSSDMISDEGYLLAPDFHGAGPSMSTTRPRHQADLRSKSSFTWNLSSSGLGL